MADEFSENPEVRFSDKIKKFIRPKFLFFIIALGAAFVLIFAVGSVRQSAGDFLASAFDAVQRAFTSSEVYIGEIPLDSLDKPADSPAPKTSASPINRTGGTSAKPAKTTQTDSKDKLINEMNNKINALQAQLSNISSTVPAVSTVVPIPSTSTQSQNQALSSQQVPAPNSIGAGRILIGEIMAGADGNSNFEFIELYNAGSAPVDLTGWSVKKKTSIGSGESPLVAAYRLLGKIVQPAHYFLLGNDGGYQGSVALDASWAHSNTLAYTNNSVVLYNGSGGRVEEIFWAEIPKGQSFVRTSWEGSQFTLSSSPTPKNSQSP